MKEFTYDINALTENQRAAIAEINASCEAEIKRLQEQEDMRAQHYYDCMDDYSWGGPCSRANMLAQDRAKAIRDIRIEEIVRGGYHIRERKVNILRSIETGEVVADGTRLGEYGRYFKTYDGKFVSCAKKVTTFEKKGYRPFVQTVVEKVKYDGQWSNGDLRFKFVDYVSITEELSTEICY